MKLELKHLAPYLPYDLKYKDIPDGFTGVRTLTINTIQWCLFDGLPILRPLSDLTKDEFDELFESLHYHSQSLILREDLVGNWAESMRYYDFKKLLANHFDVFGLIEKGLAIDKNTL